MNVGKFGWRSREEQEEEWRLNLRADARGDRLLASVFCDCRVSAAIEYYFLVQFVPYIAVKLRPVAFWLFKRAALNHLDETFQPDGNNLRHIDGWGPRG